MTTKTKVLITAQDKTKAAFNSVTRKVSGLERAVSKATFAFASLVGAGAVGGLIKSFAEAGLQMERFERAFKAATGSASAGARELKFVTDLSNELGISLEASAGAYAKLTAAAQGTVLAGEDTRKIFTSVAEASLVLGLTSDQTRGTLTALEQIISKGKVSAEELRGQLGERLPGAFQIAARSIGKTTEELDKMLKMGQLTAEDLLPKFAEELHKTFGPEVPEAAESAQAAFARFGNAVFDLQQTFATSGLLDTLANTATFLSQIAGSIGDAITTTLEERKLELIKDIAKEEQKLATRRFFGSKSDQELQIQGLQLELELTETRIKKEKELAQLAERSDPLRAIVKFEKASQELNAFFEKQGEDQAKALEKFSRKYETAEDRVRRLREELEKYRGEISKEEYIRIYNKIGEALTEGIEEISIKGLPKLKKTTKETTDEMSEYAKRAAQNMQDAFADFLFDPFEDGLKGMLKSFIDTIRRMVAEQAAAGIFDIVKQGGGGAAGNFLRFLLPGFATGGSFVVGGSGGTDSQFVPFMATPGERVTVSKPGQRSGGDISIVNNIDARGADEARIMRVMPSIMETTKTQTIATIIKMRNEGSI